jgi:hypothetical protein
MFIFEPSGKLLSEVALPGILTMRAPLRSTLIAWELNLDLGNRSFSGRHIEMDIASGEVIWERTFPESITVPADCGQGEYPGMDRALALPSGGMVITGLCRGQMVFLADRNADSGALIRAPRYSPRFPTERDVERYLEGCGPPSPGFFRPRCELEKFRITPKPYAAHYWVDDEDRLWALTNRDREVFSFLDVFSDEGFLGSVRIRHRAIGFDLLGSTLAVLVDRPVGPDDVDGFPDRGIDWYEIDGLDLGGFIP